MNLLINLLFFISVLSFDQPSDNVSFNSTVSDYSSFADKIATGKGYFEKHSQSGTVKIKNSYKVFRSNERFFRSSDNTNDGKSWFKLSGTMGYSPILIGFVPGATDDYENTHDSQFMNDGASIEFYSFIDGNKYDIQGRSELQPNQFINIPLGYEVLSAGDYTISIMLEYIDSRFDIILEDTLENTMTDLRLSDYTFSVDSPTEDNNRFVLHYNYNQTLNAVEFKKNVSGINSYFSNNELISKVENESMSITIYDLTGKQILKQGYNNIIQTGSLNSGVYVVKYTLKNSKTISKKLIRY